MQARVNVFDIDRIHIQEEGLSPHKFAPMPGVHTWCSQPLHSPHSEPGAGSLTVMCDGRRKE